MSLYSETHESLDISTSGLVLEYEFDGLAIAPKTVLAVVNIGSVDEPIVGAGPYSLLADINGYRISPDSTVNVASGVTKTRMQSRELVLVPGDTLTLTLIGLSGDLSVTTVASLIDMTPLTQTQVGGGGAVSVDHNYRSTDKYTYRTSGGAGIDNAQIQAFLEEDYDAGNRSSSFVRGEARTRSDGRWTAPIMLDTGDYILVFFKQGQYGPDTANLTVV